MDPFVSSARSGASLGRTYIMWTWVSVDSSGRSTKDRGNGTDAGAPEAGATEARPPNRTADTATIHSAFLRIPTTHHTSPPSRPDPAEVPTPPARPSIADRGP